MTTSENLSGTEPWMSAMFLPTTFSDAWFLESLSRDSETLTKAVQNSTSPSSENTISPFNNTVDSSIVTPTISGSDAETLNSKRRSNNSNVTGRVSKRKPRVSKRRSQTTFIMADVANFRSMVQQVTGVRFGNTQHVQILKPEPQRPDGGNQRVLGGCLPTLDTSAFWLDQQGIVGPSSKSVMSDFNGNGHVSFGPQPVMVGDGEFGSFPSFPTLESWKVM